MNGQVLACEQVRAFDRYASETLGISLETLMENAGRSLVESLLRHALADAKTTRFAILCGKGNNGGDGFVMARRLTMLGFRADVWTMAPDAAYKGPARTNLAILRRLGDERLTLRTFDGPDALERFDDSLHRADWLVDALLGTGAGGAPRAPLDVVIERMNRSEKPVFAVDIPSGLDGDTGMASGVCVQAAVTCTLAAFKPGLLKKEAARFVGSVELGDIGVGIEPFLTERTEKK